MNRNEIYRRTMESIAPVIEQAADAYRQMRFDGMTDGELEKALALSEAQARAQGCDDGLLALLMPKLREAAGLGPAPRGVN